MPLIKAFSPFPLLSWPANAGHPGDDGPGFEDVTGRVLRRHDRFQLDGPLLSRQAGPSFDKLRMRAGLACRRMRAMTIKV